MYELGQLLTFARLWKQNDALDYSALRIEPDSSTRSTSNVTTNAVPNIRNQVVTNSTKVNIASPLMWITDDTIAIALHEVQSALDTLDEHDAKIEELTKMLHDVDLLKRDIDSILKRVAYMRRRADCNYKSIRRSFSKHVD